MSSRPGSREGLFPFDLLLPAMLEELESTIGALKASIGMLAAEALSEDASELVAIASRQVERQQALLRSLVTQFGVELEWCRRHGPPPGIAADAREALHAAVSIVSALAPSARITLADPGSVPLLAACPRLALTRALHCLLVASLARSEKDHVRAGLGFEEGLVVATVASCLETGESERFGGEAGPGSDRGSSDPGLEACSHLAALCGGRLRVSEGGGRLRLEVPHASSGPPQDEDGSSRGDESRSERESPE